MPSVRPAVVQTAGLAIGNDAMGHERMPWRIGLTRSRDDFPKEIVQAHELKLSQAADLTSLLDTYCFYTPALMHLRVQLFGRDPFLNFIEEFKKMVVPVSIRFNKPVFSGLELGDEKSWNYYLYGMECEVFKAYRQWFGSLAFTDYQLKRVSRIREQTIRIADPLYFERAVILPEEIPVIPVTVFCLDTNQGCWYVEEGVHPLLDLPQIRFTCRIFPDTRVFADAVLQNKANPYELVEELEGLSDEVQEREIIERVRNVRKEQNP